MKFAGARSGKLIQRPENFSALIEQESRFLNRRAARILAPSGDEIDDIALVESGNVVYVVYVVPSAAHDAAAAGEPAGGASAKEGFAAPMLLTIAIAIGMAALLGARRARTSEARPSAGAAERPTTQQARRLPSDAGAGAVADRPPPASCARPQNQRRKRVAGACAAQVVAPPGSFDEKAAPPAGPRDDAHDEQGVAFADAARRVAIGYRLTLYDTSSEQRSRGRRPQ
uniref:Uncharacterized protein n=1 Tax=Prymnesium polylepis TaxID=72548 RepID=A0A6V4K5L8_9EUKA|mmetsp:Transcript_71889/g.216096  ORF Transcript_71889/g.216096 Transcript_71889/m.216096 type:complete len:228 (-) Transcript_71889:47-730(-)